MNPVRAVLIAVPVLFVVLFAASFWAVRSLTNSEVNELTIGSIGEPKVLNPIQAADNAASEIMHFIFEGLIQFDENLQMEGDLAERWELAQTSRIFFATPEEAAAALAKIHSLPDGAGSYGITGSQVDSSGTELQIFLSKPGKRVADQLTETAQIQGIKLAVFAVAADEGLPQALAALKSPDVKQTWSDQSVGGEIVYKASEAVTPESITKQLEALGAKKVQVEMVEECTRLDEPQVTFFLRRDVKWQDGVPFTSADVDFTYRMLMNPDIASPRKADFDTVKSLSTPDDYTVKVVYRRPFSPALTSWGIELLPKHILEGKSSKWWAENFNKRPIGTGPYKFEKWKVNEFISIVKDPNYREGSPHIDRINFRVIPDQTALRLAFETKQIDFWDAMPHAVGSFIEDKRFQTFTSPDYAYTYVGWNLRKPLFQDVRVRRALAHAVNVPDIVKHLLYGMGEQSHGIYIPQLWFFNPNVKPLEYDPQKSAQLLAEAGWKPGPDGILVKDGKRFEFTLITNNANEIRKDVATLVQSDLKKLGIAMKVEMYEWAVFLSKYINPGEFDACVLGWTTGLDYDQYQIWHSSQIGPQQLNFVAYKNEKVDKLLNDLRSEYDTEEIKKLAGELQQTIYDDQPYLFLYTPRGTSVVWKDAFRVKRPVNGEFKDEPMRMTKAGFTKYIEWFYRPSQQHPAMTENQ